MAEPRRTERTARSSNGVVKPLLEAYDHLIHQRRGYALVCMEHALAALGVDPATGEPAKENPAHEEPGGLRDGAYQHGETRNP